MAYRNPGQTVRLACKCGAICLIAESDLRKRAGQRLRCRRCRCVATLPGPSGPPAILYPASPISLPGAVHQSIPTLDWSSGESEQLQGHAAGRLRPIVICLCCLAAVVVVELAAFRLIDAAKERVAPAARAARDAANGAIQEVAGHAASGREILVDGVTQPAKRLDELERAADEATGRPSDKTPISPTAPAPQP